MSLLSIEGLAVTFNTRQGPVLAVKDVSLSVEAGETLAIVGESGSGKSVTALSVLNLLGKRGGISGGDINFDGRSLRGLSQRELREVRGRQISIIFQNPMEALNPIRKVGDQISDVLVEHKGLSRTAARAEAIGLMEDVRIADAPSRYDAYPFQLSGGMCQRIMIAIAISCSPRLLIADEPTTGLDVTTQKVIMDIVRELCSARGMACMIITHDLALASEYANRIIVMQGGSVIEAGAAEEILRRPQVAYTKRLIAATPRRGEKVENLLPESERMSVDPVVAHQTDVVSNDAPLLDVRNLTKVYPGKKGTAGNAVRAVDDVSFSIRPGESLGLVGESGSGKTTISRMVARLVDPSAGQILFQGQEISGLGKTAFAQSPLRRGIQYVFQDPSSSLNPRWTAFDCIADPLKRLGTPDDRRNLESRVATLADRAGLPQSLLSRLPHQLSGGQKARVGIARAIALDPRLLILDEPTTALDVSVQAVVLNQLNKLKRELGFSFLFISHDLAVVSMLCERVVIMRSGKIEEEGAADRIFEAPNTEYVRTLVASIPHMR
jgi:peptide/nickel transport system ATP-binding protein